MSSYKTILIAGRLRDLATLRTVLTHCPIDTWKRGKYFFSAVSQVALENNPTALEFLLHHGANLNYAVLGAAMAGNVALVDDLLQRGASLNWAVFGAAQEKASVIINDPTKESIGLIDNLLQRGANIRYAVFGAALAGNKIRVEELLERPGANINEALEGAEMGHQHRLSKTLRTRPEVDITRKTFYEQGAALHGPKSLEKQLKKLGNAANMDNAALGAGMRGDLRSTKKLLRLGAQSQAGSRGAAFAGKTTVMLTLLGNNPPKKNVNETIHGAAKGGHTVLVETLLKQYKANINFAIQGTACSGHTDLLEKLLKNSKQKKISIRHAIKAATQNGHLTSEENVFRFLVFFKDDKIRKKFTETVDPSKRIKEKIKHVHYFKNQYDFDIPQAITTQQNKLIENWPLQDVSARENREDRWYLVVFWFMQCAPHLSKKTNADIVFEITQFIFPSLSENKAQELHLKINHSLLKYSIFPSSNASMKKNTSSLEQQRFQNRML